MDISVTPTKEPIRKIEDIIDIQKADGNFTVRQVAFNLPTDSEAPVGANLARSLESGLSQTKPNRLGKEKKKLKKRSKRQKSPVTDVISWPSDSDITVLRMKLSIPKNELKEKVGLVPGDGLHQDGSSMVNLATLMRHSQPPSKHSIIEEYLLPLTSWEGQDNKTVLEKSPNAADLNHDFNAVYSGKEDVFQRDQYSESSTKSKIARFLRLYFCPCCRCLYRMENMSDDHSTYWEKRKGHIFQ